MSPKMKPKPATDLSIKAFARDFVKETFYLDHRLMKTLAMLFGKPGRLTLLYFKNPGSQYIQPLKLYFAINFIFFLLIPILNTPHFRLFSFNMKSMIYNNPRFQQIIENEIQKSGVKPDIYEERFNANVKYNKPAFIFLVVPVFALLLFAVNFRRRRYYIEHLIFAFHFLSFYLLILLLIIAFYRAYDFGAKLFGFSVGSGALVLGILVFLVPWLYLIRGTQTFYQNKLLMALLKAAILMAGFWATISGYVIFLFFYTTLVLRVGY